MLPIFLYWACLATYTEGLTQFIAALGDAGLESGDNAELWGFWHVDPGPRGVSIGSFNNVLASSGVAPTGWTFNMSDWWVEEYGRLMEKPAIPIEPGTYTVSNFRRGSSPRVMLTISPASPDGHQKWQLTDAQLTDVTHGPCRTGRYTPVGPSSECSPANMPSSEFPVASGGLMPTLEGCHTLDYRVLFVHAFEPAVMVAASQASTMAPSATDVSKTMVANSGSSDVTLTMGPSLQTSLQGTQAPVQAADTMSVSCRNCPMYPFALAFYTLCL